MRFWPILVPVLAGWSGAFADDLPEAQDSPRGEALHPPIPYELIEARLAANRAALGLDAAREEPGRDTFERILFPVRASANATPFRVHLVENFVDHDAYGPGFLQDYECGLRTYDLPGGYDHAGTDYVASTFQELSTEDSWMEVIAAAGGVILDRHDGEPDRNAQGRNESLTSNYVIIRQDDGMEVFYYHLALNSVIPGEIGDRVEAGDYLGIAASSGTSSEPHLHFQMHHPALFQRIVDPYGGPCSNGPETVWQHQHAYVDPAITGIFTHSAAPVRPARYGPEEVPSFRQRFDPGDEVFASVFVRDQASGAAVSADMIDPTGAIVASHEFTGSTFPVTETNHSVFSYTLPVDAAAGVWRIRARFEGDLRERAFYVGRTPDAGAQLGAAILPLSRSVQAGQPATVFATVINPSGVLAEGCWIGPGAPFEGRFRYRMTDPATNAAFGEENRLFDVPAGGSRSFVLSFTPEATASGEGFDLPIRYKCDNGDAAAILPGINSVLLSFGPVAPPDLIAIALTPTSDGILRLADENTNGAFAVAVANVGASSELTVQPAAAGSASGIGLTICETDPGTGACLADAGNAVTRTFAQDEMASFAIFALPRGQGIPFAPGSARIRVEARDSSGVIRGATSVAVRTD
ncbi:peptidoglycan DD-metalloendopeptidase family protein [Hyphobacterium sp. HN65]|uniref:Peptidoglycan DD-metalloendopeptidase family protein n=1 Tax=Hyphobacterium lacteum TaxID=3116575 RepID=A0ABU7LP89_9PROT|nr:peptidoglycan DD-metalloendopeptidase family protein [Hyphobacterium sp. HN65]MEE2525414.1 peptidoglycan DD-metalloendopeptidase family protein [Hyphobacterium sp. HN65]